MSDYRHRFSNGDPCDLPVGKVICVGRNYAAHAKELNNPVPSEPMLFIKSANALAHLEASLTIPHGRGSCHFETEMALLIGSRLSDAPADTTIAAIQGVGVALDLTLRDEQSRLKEKGHPWEVAKSFDGACPVSAFVPYYGRADLGTVGIRMVQNGELRQGGSTSDMITPVAELLSFMSQRFTLMPGDIVLTGTPEGVGPLLSGDKLAVELVDWLTVATSVR